MRRRSAAGVRMDRDRRGGAGRRPNNAGPVPVDRPAADGGSNGGMKLVRLDLPRRSEESRREATCRELGRNRRGPLGCQRLRTAARTEISADRGRTGSADDCDADNEGCETVREAHENCSDLNSAASERPCGVRIVARSSGSGRETSASNSEGRRLTLRTRNI